MQVAANPRLCGVDITEVVRTVDNPEFPVASRKVENVFVLRQHNQSGEPDFGVYRYDVLLRVLYRSAADCSLCRKRSKCNQTNNCKSAHGSANALSFRESVHTVSPGPNSSDCSFFERQANGCFAGHAKRDRKPSSEWWRWERGAWTRNTSLE